MKIDMGLPSLAFFFKKGSNNHFFIKRKWLFVFFDFWGEINHCKLSRHDALYIFAMRTLLELPFHQNEIVHTLKKNWIFWLNKLPCPCHIFLMKYGKIMSKLKKNNPHIITSNLDFLVPCHLILQHWWTKKNFVIELDVLIRQLIVILWSFLL